MRVVAARTASPDERAPGRHGVCQADGAARWHSARGRSLSRRVSAGHRAGELLQCHAHGALFEKHTGLCIAGPCVDDSLRRLPVTVVGAEVRLSEELDTSRLTQGPW
jgi:nitrite reductase/ring-hydroxylating ferredoxin subunit